MAKIKNEWRDSYLPASFKGVQFYVQRHSVPIGRVRKVHEFPNRDFPNVEDVRAKTKLYSMDVYILGDNYFDQRNALITAYDEVSSGLLVHPYLGNIQVFSLEGSVTETVTEGRVARFTLQFVQVELASLTGSFIDISSSTTSNIDAMFGAALEYLLELYDYTQYPADFLGDAVEVLDQSISIISAAKKIANADDDFRNQVDLLKEKLTVELLTNITELFEDLKDLVSFGILSSSGATAEEFKQMIDEQDSIINSITVGDNEAANIINESIKQIALTTMLSLSVDASYTSVEDVVDSNQSIFNNLTKLEDDNNAMGDYQFIVRKSRYTLTANIDNITGTLGNVWEYVVPDIAIPPMIISTQLYGNSDKENDILKINNIGNPFFGTGNLQVLDYE